MILLDTSGLLAFLDKSEKRNEQVTQELYERPDAPVISPFVLAELDYLVRQRLHSNVMDIVLEDIANGAYTLAPFSATDIKASLKILSRFQDLDIGLTDASIVVLADRYRTRDILTLDHRHFQPLRNGRGQPFRLFPAK